ncbi:MAG: DUF5059 domain-containing protein, partial [Halobacteria archaeon]|nr:DUF5059 domain-containing protein [Halobacteria archaeon]
KNDRSVFEAAKKFNDKAVEAVYTIVSSAGGSHGAEAASIMQDVFAEFENAKVHEMLEKSDKDAYESFESALNDYISALKRGGAQQAAERFATASLRAQFAVVGAVGKAPVGESSGGGHRHGGEKKLESGPNVVKGVPEDADHVVDMKAVSYDPAKLEVKKGDKVAWKHSAGEAHTVTAYADNIPEGATYWASGGFSSEEKEKKGWENGEGAVQSGQSYVHTFETTGTHEY